MTCVFIVIYKAFCLDVAQGRMNGAPNGTRTHSCRFANLAYRPLHHSNRVYIYIYINLTGKLK